MTASALRASSAGVAAAVAPAAITGFNLSAERFHTATLCPTSMSRCAMAAPILPIPAIPICIGCALLVALPLRCNSGRRPYGIMRARERQSPGAAPRGHIELERSGGRRVASAARLIGNGGWQWRKAKSVSSASASWAARSRATSLAAGWRVVGYDIDRGAPPGHGASRRRDRGRCESARRRGCRPSSPACPSPPRSMRR